MESFKSEIIKSLKVKSPQDLYHILKNINYKDDHLIPFMDRMELFLHGCACDSEKYWDQSISEYKKISKLNLSNLKKEIDCTTIQFYLESELLFSV